MEWLAKATDLLDKVDQLAAERLADEEDAEVADEDVLALLDAAEREEGPAAHAPAGDAAAAAATPPSPRGELQSEVERLKKSLQKKSAHIEQLVASQRALLKTKAAREDELNEQVTKLRQEIDQSAVHRKLGEQGRKHTEQQMEAMKQSLKSKSEELGAARDQLSAVTQERDAAHERIAAMEETQQQQEKAVRDLQEKYNHSLQQVSATRMEHRSELHDLQDREESLSSATVQFTAELARSERRRQESESAAREAAELQRVAEERVRELERAADEQQRASQDKDSVVARLQQALDARDSDQESERSRLEAESRESRKRVEEVEMQLRQMEKQLSEATRAAARAASHSSTMELEEQLGRMCQDVLAKQALLEQIMSEKTALRSRLESEAIRNTDLQNELARMHAAKALMSTASRDLEAGRGGLSEPVADAIQLAIKARDVGSIFRAVDSILQHSAAAVAQDTAVRAVAGGYFLILQVSAFIVLVHALLGSHHHH